MNNCATDEAPRFIDAASVARLTPMPALIAALKTAFASPPVSPTRHHHTIELDGDEPDATLLLMPAWRSGHSVGVKIATVFPSANQRNQPAVQATYLLNDGLSGRPLAILDGAMLTARRTAAASALAASFLARDDARTLLMVGAGTLAPHLIEAHCSVRPIDSIKVWGRNAEKTQRRVASWEFGDRDIHYVDDLQGAASEADIISCATLSTQALILGDWLKPGAHLDLVGAFRPDMRECDDQALVRAEVYVDTRAGALAEAGDLLQPIASGAFAAEDIVAELSDLCAQKSGGRKSGETITLYKSVGASLMDLAAAELVFAAQ